MADGPRVRNVVFTINKDGEEDLLLLDPTHPTWNHIRYCIYQREMGSHEHFQGYLELQTAQTYSALHMFDGLERARFDKRRGSAKQASHYCEKPVEGCDCPSCLEELREPTKLEGPWTWGEMSQQGVRADLLEIKREIDHGASLKRLWSQPDTFPTMVKHHRAFETYKHITTPSRKTKPIVFLFIGPSGLGKSRTMWNIARKVGGDSVYKVPPKSTGFWCDRYEQEEVFIIDEMSGNKMTPEFFNELCDWEQMDLPVHGSLGRQFTSKYLFIGTNYHPKFWWKKRSVDQVKQTMRRIDVVFKMFPPQPPPQPCPHCVVGKCAFHHI